MKIEEIEIGKSYLGKGGGTRRVCAINKDMVTYTIPGLLSIAPMRMPLPEFAEWAQSVVD
jgi:hypothetical protein